MTVHAPAKVNLVLRVLGKRADGFHDIETLMVPLDIADEITVEAGEGEGIEFSCDDPGVPSDATNLAWRAAEAFAKETGKSFHARIALRKVIPAGAGLAGGSSDAAAVLLALDALLGTELGTGRLRAVAATLGSDIPFFIDPRPSWCRGRGEVIEAAAGIPALDLLLVKPPFPVATGWAYQAWAKSAAASAGSRVGDLVLTNDLEAPVFEKFLLLPALKDWLTAQSGVAAAMMSGSGSTLFAVLDGPAAEIDSDVRAMFGEDMWTVRVRTLASPAV